MSRPAFFTVVFSLMAIDSGNALTAAQDNSVLDACRQGRIAFDAGRFDEAVAALSRAIELDPKFVPAWILRGMAFYKKQEPKMAHDDFSGAILLAPKMMDSYGYRALCHIDLGNLASALKDIETALKVDMRRDPASTSAGYAMQGLIRMLQGKLEKAIDSYDQAISLKADNSEALRGRGDCFLQQGKLEKALQDVNKAIEFDPKEERNTYTKARVLHEMKEFAKAIAEFDKVIAGEGVNSELPFLGRGKSLLAMSKPREAIKDFTEAIRLAAIFPDPYLQRGLAFMAVMDAKAALTDFSKFIELKPDEPMGYRSRAAAFRMLGKEQDAEQDERKARVLTEKEAQKKLLRL